MVLSLHSSSPEQTSGLAQELARFLTAGNCLVLSGDLGAGKTWFSAALLAQLAVNQVVHSPTFTLVNVYHTATGMTVYHADFYRLDSVDELWAAGWEDYLDGSGLLLVEWGERFPSALPDDYLHIHLQIDGPTKRTLLVQSHGPHSHIVREGWSDALAGR